MFPNWLGAFENSTPTLAGLDHVGVIRALENGLINISELDGLLLLMRNPKVSPFLPVHTDRLSCGVYLLVSFPEGPIAALLFLRVHSVKIPP